MFLVSEYVFLDYNESFIQVIIDYIAILCEAVCLLYDRSFLFAGKHVYGRG